MTDKHVVLYCDGSCRGNPGYGGYGVYGYIYTEAAKPKNHKHPAYGTLYFTPSGITNIKSESHIEVISIIEHIEALGNPLSTNNDAELQAAITAFELTTAMADVKTLTIYTDSNYVVSCYNNNMEKWKANNWKRQDDKPIVHIVAWQIIDKLDRILKANDVSISINWVKGHSDSHGNNIADMYSVIGSNAARHISNNQNNTILHSISSYADYKKSYIGSDFIFNYRDMYFSSDKLDDNNYCFIGTSDDENIMGKRNNAAIFLCNIGYVPSVINKLKEFYRSIERSYIVPCCAKISMLKNKDIYRLINFIDIKYLLVKSQQQNTYMLVGDTTSFLYEVIINSPFVVSTRNIFDKIIDTVDNMVYNPYILKYNVTDIFINKDTKKLKITNKDNTIDLSEMVKNTITLKQNLIIKVGYDLPSYLALKGIEESIIGINMLVEYSNENNFCTVYMHIETENRNIYSVNVENKYLRKNK